MDKKGEGGSSTYNLVVWIAILGFLAILILLIVFRGSLFGQEVIDTKINPLFPS
ncbi:MAG TPA: hypothetical protein VJB12_04180 [Candidatus Nanoarchaeia archaeon]|nr:hypothetical protein [Candidatus Nanoarchaeia archaeon]